MLFGRVAKNTSENDNQDVSNEVPIGSVGDPSVPTAAPVRLSEALRELQNTLYMVAGEAGEDAREQRRKARIYEEIRNTRSFDTPAVADVPPTRPSNQSTSGTTPR